MRFQTGSIWVSRRKIESQWMVAVFVLFAMCSSASAIKCYVCNSYSELYCSENWALDGLSEEIQPVDCDETYEAQYCVKTTGMYQGEIGTRRFCSAKHLGNYCDWNSRPGDLNERGQKREYRACIYTCGSDGCNSAQSLRPSMLFVVPLLYAIAKALSG